MNFSYPVFQDIVVNLDLNRMSSRDAKALVQKHYQIVVPARCTKAQFIRFLAKHLENAHAAGREAIDQHNTLKGAA